MGRYTYKFLIGTSALFFSISPGSASIFPEPVYPIPTERQLSYQRGEVGTFFHFSLNAYYGREWGTGNEDPGRFNPTAFDASQWADAVEAMGSNLAVIVIKHHSGFSMYDTSVSDYDITATPWKNGQGDMFGELMAEFNQRGIKVGLYISPWDRHDPAFGTDQYNDNFITQLNETILNYGSDIREVWFDGAGADQHDFDWSRILQTVRSLAPNAIVFNHAEVRWSGNEAGFAGLTEWSVRTVDEYRNEKVARGRYSEEELSTAIGINGTLTNANAAFLGNDANIDLIWRSAEADTPIRHCWFHVCESVKSFDEIINIYFNSVGRNSNLLLNYSPDLTGRIPEEEISRARAMRDTVRETFNHNLLLGASVSSSNLRNNDTAFSPNNLLDNDLSTYWATNDNIHTGDVTFNLGVNTISFDTIQLREHIELGQRVEKFSVDARTTNGAWVEVATGTTIGNKRILRLAAKFNAATELRLNIKKARGLPVISEFGVYQFNRQVGFSIQPTAEYFRDSIQVSVEHDGTNLYYTTDGSEPTTGSTPYSGSFSIASDATVKVLTSSGIISQKYTKLLGAQENLALQGSARQSSSHPQGAASKAIDGNTSGNFRNSSVTHTAANESDLDEPWWEVDLGRAAYIDEIKVFNRTDCCKERLKNSIIIVSNVPFTSVTKFDVLNQTDISEYPIESDDALQVKKIQRTGRYIRIYGNGNDVLSLAEVEVLGSQESLLFNIAQNKSASQSSSNSFSTRANKAIDGITSGNIGHNSIAHTRPNTDATAWWQLDLLSSTKIKEITVHSRTDCCTERMNEFYVALSEKPIANSIEQATQDPNVTILVHNVSQFVPKVTFAVDANVRYVKILQGTPNEILQIAEVEVFSDEPDEGVLLSRYGHATQSSVYQNKMAALAIDGNYSGRYQDGSVFHTQVSGDTAPWWQIDLGESYPLSHMKLFNRSDCCMDRLSDINILLSDQPFGDADFSLLETRSDITILPVYTQMLENNVVQIPLGYRARYVRVQKTQGSILSLAEVDIYSDVANPLVNVTNNAVVSQSSTLPNSPSPQVVVDGNTNGTYNAKSTTHTNWQHGLESWLDIDLGTEKDIHSIEVYNRTDCCANRLQDSKILISNQPFANDSLAQARSKASFEGNLTSADRQTFNVNGKGRYVRIQQNAVSGYLSLSEVKVIAER